MFVAAGSVMGAPEGVADTFVAFPDATKFLLMLVALSIRVCWAGVNATYWGFWQVAETGNCE